MRFLILCVTLVLGACTLVNQSQSNHPPSLEGTTINAAQVGRGKPVRVQVVATDEDYDPLTFHWQAYRMDRSVLDAVLDLSPTGLLDDPDQLRSFYGLLETAETVGGFADSSAQTVNTWFAPQEIKGTSEPYLLTATVRDRDCSIIADPDDRADCVASGSQFVQLYGVEVTQRPPSVVLPADTTVSFAEPELSLQARISDPDGDALQVNWSQTQGPEMQFTVHRLPTGDSRLGGVPLFPGDYAFSARVSDGAAADSASARVHVRMNPDPPEGGMADLVLPNGQAYAIDRYEYPNQRGDLPLLTDSWFDAARICAEQGKRLCTQDEWVHACRGSEPQPYSSQEEPPQPADGTFGFRFCNTAGSESAGGAPTPGTNRAPSGTYPNCFSDYGVYDLTGNVREWVARVREDGSVVGGISESDVQDQPPNPCSAVLEFTPLPSDLNHLDPDAVNQVPPEYSEEYLRHDVGLRCCR